MIQVGSNTQVRVCTLHHLLGIPPSSGEVEGASSNEVDGESHQRYPYRHLDQIQVGHCQPTVTAESGQALLCQLDVVLSSRSKMSSS